MIKRWRLPYEEPVEDKDGDYVEFDDYQAAQPVVSVQEMKTSAGMDYFVHIRVAARLQRTLEGGI
jgi:hypothetical protein